MRDLVERLFDSAIIFQENLTVLIENLDQIPVCLSCIKNFYEQLESIGHTNFSNAPFNKDPQLEQLLRARVEQCLADEADKVSKYVELAAASNERIEHEATRLRTILSKARSRLRIENVTSSTARRPAALTCYTYLQATAQHLMLVLLEQKNNARLLTQNKTSCMEVCGKWDLSGRSLRERKAEISVYACLLADALQHEFS